MPHASPPKKAVVLLSGGLDSATAAAIARADGYVCHALSVDYGQRHRTELEAARRVGAALGVVEHRTVTLDLRTLGGSALTDDIDVPKDRSETAMDAEIPVTYVPARNTVLLGLALAAAEVVDARDVFIGVNAVDYSGYPDCRPAFIEAFERLANVATRMGVEAGDAERIKIHAPLLELTKAQIIQRGLALGVDYGLTRSCYDPGADDRPCGRCDSCRLRAAGFRDAGLPDPALAPTSRRGPTR